ncbi:dihydrodipicolinate reductase [Candidatus Bathyarchaeota archaeon]|nr:dihydrodipicolinate reductase [Candidatus Bathyarchaeota archaeon]MBS7612815.1 dihydrodipicolinate reductase [Candidatus Bathyarchaeota archaeon]
MVKVLQYGVGSIGSKITKALASKPWIEIVGAVDSDEAKIGKDLGVVAGLGKKIDVKICGSLNEALKYVKADVVLHTTSSWLSVVEPQILEIVENRLSVISTCEELAYPWRKNPETAKRIDETARKNGVVVLGTGVNPGFVLDTMILTLTSVCISIDRIEAWRIVDASKRRLPLQRKIGSGMSLEEFKSAVQKGRMGHIGLRESFDMIADSLGWKFDHVEENLEPVIASTPIETEFFKIKPGQVTGVSQNVRGTIGNVEKLKLNLQMYLNAENPRDTVKIEGVPSLEFEVKNGIPGDDATVAIVINMIPRVLNAEPGLRTMKDLKLPFAWLRAF